MKYINATVLLPDELVKELQEHKKGISMEELADRYYLSVHAVRKIIYQN